MAIKLLDNEVINKIAAGEVIERPASIVKELVENAIDAGSSRIAVSIQNGGIEEIIVEDNGNGIDFEELPLAFLRHATSKLSREEDLYDIHTMGFRGEALPSIASVARVEVFTKAAGNDGSHCIIDGGSIKELSRYPTAQGTKIIIRDLFYNTPVRKTFLKSPVSEGNNIYDTVCKYSLAYPEISFEFDNHKKTQFKTPGNNILRDTVFTLYGSDLSEFLLDLDVDGSQYSLQGLISKPEYKKNNRRLQMFFVNRRPVRSPLLARAVDNAYRGLLVSQEYPVCFLSLTMPADRLDVNIHPQKSEVRFQDEQTVFRFVSQVLKSRLDETSYGPGRYLQNEYHFLGYRNQPTSVYKKQFAFSNMYAEEPLFDRQYDQETGEIMAALQPPLFIQTDKKINQGFSLLGQLADAYILAESDAGLYIIDQHAAHERIWFNRLNQMYKASSVQQLLVLPLALDLSSEQTEQLEACQDVLAELGFIIEILGHNSIVLRAVPNFVVGKELEFMTSILDLLQEGEKINLKEEILSSMACEKAVTAGQKLSMEEMVQIVSDLLGEENYKNCPHGRPTMIHINATDLQRMFKRQK